VGGSQLTRADGVVIFEALAYGDVSATAFLTIHNMCAAIIENYGTAEQRQLLLPELTSMVFSSPLIFSCSNCMRQVRWRYGIGLGLCDEA
jgi:alkylation response protein AidB-like acyl-CoA dehydrogenase